MLARASRAPRFETQGDCPGQQEELARQGFRLTPWAGEYILINPRGEIRLTRYRQTRVVAPRKINGTICLESAMGRFNMGWLMASVFVPNPHGYSNFIHIDRDLQNFDADNLLWVESTLPYQGNRLTGSDIRLIELSKGVRSRGDLAQLYGIPPAKVTQIWLAANAAGRRLNHVRRPVSSKTKIPRIRIRESIELDRYDETARIVDLPEELRRPALEMAIDVIAGRLKVELDTPDLPYSRPIKVLLPFDGADIDKAWCERNGITPDLRGCELPLTVLPRGWHRPQVPYLIHPFTDINEEGLPIVREARTIGELADATTRMIAVDSAIGAVGRIHGLVKRLPVGINEPLCRAYGLNPQNGRDVGFTDLALRQMIRDLPLSILPADWLLVDPRRPNI